ncbi:hypothetical protein D3C73_1466370 [compost metagenome]
MEGQTQTDTDLQLQVIVNFLLQIFCQGIECLVKRFSVVLLASNQRNNSVVNDHRSKSASRRNQLFNHIMGGKQQQMEILFVIAVLSRKVDAKCNNGHGSPFIH